MVYHHHFVISSPIDWFLSQMCNILGIFPCPLEEVLLPFRKSQRTTAPSPSCLPFQVWVENVQMLYSQNNKRKGRMMSMMWCLHFSYCKWVHICNSSNKLTSSRIKQHNYPPCDLVDKAPASWLRQRIRGQEVIRCLACAGILNQLVTGKGRPH